MSKTQPTRRGRIALSIIPLAMVAAIGVGVSAHAQSPGAPDTAASAQAHKEATSKRTTAAASPGPFTYDAVGATPKVRKPGKPDVASPAVKTPTRANAAGSETTAQHNAAKELSSPVSR